MTNRLAHIFAFVLCFASAMVSAQTDSPPQAEKGSPYAAIKDRVSTSDLEESQKEQSLATLSQAESNLAEAESNRSSAAKRTAALETVSQRALAAKSTLDDLKDAKITQPSDESLADLESELASISAELKAAKLALDESESVMKGATQRSAQIDSELPKLTTMLQERTQQRDDAIASADGSLLKDILVTELSASVKLIESKITAMQAEKTLLSAEVAAKLPQLTRDLKARRVELLTRQQAEWRKTVQSQRAKDARARVTKATRQISDISPELRFIGQQNRDLATLNESLAAENRIASKELTEQTTELEGLRSLYKQAKERVDKVGLTDAVGATLRNLKQRLPNLSVYRIRIRDRVADINDASYQLMEMNDRRTEKEGIALDMLMRQVDSPNRSALREEARDLLIEQRTEFLDPAIRTQSQYFTTLVSISTVEREIITLVEGARKYINEKVFWIRSTQPLYSQPLPNHEEWWFTLPSAWEGVGSKIFGDAQRRLSIWVAITVIFSCIVVFRYRLRNQIGVIGKQVEQSGFIYMGPTIKACLLTIAISIPIPLLFGFLGERFASIAGTDRTLNALALASATFTLMYFSVDLTRQVCRKHGLAESHFDWPRPAVAQLRRQLRLLLWITIPLAALAAFLAGGGIGYGNDVLQRYLSIAATVTLGVFVYRVAHPRRGMPAYFLAKNSDGWASQLAPIWFPALVAIPTGLTVLSLIGYHFTSQQIGWRVFLSVWLLFSSIVAISLVMRWSTIHRRRIRIEQVHAVRAQRQQEADSKSKDPPTLGLESGIIAEEDTPGELKEQMRQSRRLFQTVMGTAAFIGLWIVWRDVIPAFEIFEKWPLWTSTTTVTEILKNEAGEIVTETVEVLDRITIAEVILAALVLLVAFAAARNLPGLLEFAILRKLPIDRSIRYAVTTLVSYLIVLIGVIIAGSTVGLHWNQIQWMATALTFGLAFGLQEMFANFVAGIIILFEQPVRVGDVVEIDGITGIVSKIRIRATTITDWDRKDYIVPNKEFITGKLLNWTRSDEIVRVQLAVGIAYGSDTKLAKRLILETASEHPDVLDDPPVIATFDEFGDNSLNFKLRVFVKTYERRLHILDELHMEIDRKFRDANIEISFPQRDLHIRGLPKEMRHFFASAAKQKRADEDSVIM